MISELRGEEEKTNKDERNMHTAKRIKTDTRWAIK